MLIVNILFFLFFQHFTHGVLDPEICERLYELLHGSKPHQQMRKGHHEGEVDHHHFAHHLAAILKGGPSEQAVLLASLVSPDHEGVLPEHLVKVHNLLFCFSFPLP